MEIKRYIHLDICELYHAMKEKNEISEMSVYEFINTLDLDIEYEESRGINFGLLKEVSEWQVNEENKDFYQLITTIYEFISFYYNIYDDIIYLDMGVIKE